MNVGSIGRRIRAFTLVAAVLLVSVAGPAGVSTASAQDATITTRVIILHAGTDVGDVEVHINNESELDNFAYGDQSDWIDINPGSARVTITADRSGFNYVLFDTVYPIPAGNDFYLVISDSLILTGIFDTSAVAAQGSTVAVLHASVDTPPVSVAATGDAVTFATELGYSRTSDATGVPNGTYDVEVALADTGDVLLTQPGVVIEPSMSYILVFMGDPGSTDKPLEIVALGTDLKEDTGTPAS
ncbi:MAG TPA: DUF4397 domain-containing protein [Thermomicrobiales bacterium]|nr:DUF4397 domain-containing protein [Thermomicrobiales bacterium]